MSDDFDDTVISPRRPLVDHPELDNSDTIVAGTRAGGAPLPLTAPPANDATVVSARSGFYSFRLGSRPDAISLDLPAWIGRRPSTPRVVAGAPPRLVRVASPQREVSATHLEVRQLGSSVIVTDLRSTNGSVVMLPGSVPRKLRQGESVVVSPGTLVDIGDENVLQILPMKRL